MKIATYNVNGVNGRLPVLLRWLKETTPDVVCLQELKAPEEKFPQQAIEEAGYQAIWHGQKSWNGVAILSRAGAPKEIRRVLPGDEEDVHSRYIEATVSGIIVGCLYLPNGNPAPGPKFDYKLRWFERLNRHAADLLKSKKTGGAGRGLQCNAHGTGCVQTGTLDGRCPVPAGKPRRVSYAVGGGMDGCHPFALSSRGDLYFLGLF